MRARAGRGVKNGNVAEPTIDELIDAVDDVLRTTLSLAFDLTLADADRPTECPGWTVRDQLSHMVGLEQVLSGAPEPRVDLPPLHHVSSELDAFMERQVHARRALPLASIADELAGFRPRRIVQLRRLAAQGDPMIPGPAGERRLSAALPIRAFDLWTHEQDIRRAVGLPVRIDCAAAEVAIDRSVAAWTSALPERFADLDGDLVVLVRGDPPREARITLGRGGATATLTGDVGELTRFFAGRTVPDDDALHGDEALVIATRDRWGMTP